MRFDPARLTWTRPQRRVLLLLLTLLLVVFVIRYAFNPTYVSDPQPERPARYGELDDRIDPNTADWPALAALPGIGEKRAKDIVAYREEAKARVPGGVVFTRREDLLRIKGVGLTMMESISPYLRFPGAPATGPAQTAPSATAPGR